MDDRTLLARIERLMGFAEIPLKNAMRDTPTIRPAGEPLPNMEVVWRTNYATGQEWMEVLKELRGSHSASTNEEKK